MFSSLKLYQRIPMLLEGKRNCLLWWKKLHDAISASNLSLIIPNPYFILTKIITFTYIELLFKEHQILFCLYTFTYDVFYAWRILHLFALLIFTNISGIIFHVTFLGNFLWQPSPPTTSSKKTTLQCVIKIRHTDPIIAFMMLHFKSQFTSTRL